MCVRPIVVKENVVPCGKCFECRKQDRNSWSIRVQHEIKEGSFITLTYDEKNVPDRVIKKHLQDYIKRLRERIRKNDETFKLKYFGVGEYGDRFGRPHYHLITNCVDIDNIKNAWKYGIVHVGRPDNPAIHYCTKYVQKNIGKTKEKKERREFRIMSKGLGMTYINKYGEHHKNNLLMYLIKNDLKYTLPRYYKDKIFKEIKEKKEYRIEVNKNAERRLKKLCEKYENMLRKETDEKKIEKYNNYLQKFKSLELLIKNLTT